jgi:hypothetical protein
MLIPDLIETLPARRIVVAWKDTREARRAVRDAIPFLQVLNGSRSRRFEQGRKCTQQELNDVSAYLAVTRWSLREKAYLHTKDTVESEPFTSRKMKG